MILGDTLLGFLAWLGATVLGTAVAIIFAHLYVKTRKD